VSVGAWSGAHAVAWEVRDRMQMALRRAVESRERCVVERREGYGPSADASRGTMRMWALEWRAWRQLFPGALLVLEQKGGVL
jgi:hypothetical protein